MSSEESERIAICCVLLDIVEAMGTSADIKGCRHYQSLRDKTDITDSDFEGARSVSVLSSLVTLKGMHYNKKMLLALTVCIIRKTKNQDFKNEKSKKTANDLLIAFIV